MVRPKSLKVFSFILFCVNLVMAGKICDSNNEECTKTGAKAAYSLFVNGIDGLVASSDPASLSSVVGNLPTVKYELRDGQLTGLKNCDITLMTVNKENSTFNFHLHCPKLEVNTDYTLIGTVNDIFVEGDGKLIVKLDNYILKISGIYEKTSGTDSKEHVHIKKYFLDVEHGGKVHIDFQNLYGGDKERSDAFNVYLNEHWADMDKTFRAPALYSVMDVFIKNLKDFLALIPAEEVFPELS